jgi:glutamate-1-semialdehyde 2,1-aminomutase
MKIGGIKEEGSERVFLTSTTHGAEMCGLGAFVRTIEFYKSNNVIDHLWEYGTRLINGINNIAKELNIQEYFEAVGIPCSPNYVSRDMTGNTSLPFRTLFSQEMIKNGVLIPWIALSYAHGDNELQHTLIAVRNSLKIYAKALDEGVEKYLVGPVIKPVFRTIN